MLINVTDEAYDAVLCQLPTIFSYASLPCSNSQIFTHESTWFTTFIGRKNCGHCVPSMQCQNFMDLNKSKFLNIVLTVLDMFPSDTSYCNFLAWILEDNDPALLFTLRSPLSLQKREQNCRVIILQNSCQLMLLGASRSSFQKGPNKASLHNC